MNRILIFLLLLSASTFAQSEDLKTLSPTNFKTQGWYPNMLSQFVLNNKIDSMDAAQLKLLSSDSRMASGTCANVIKTNGKLSESDIHAIAFDKRSDSLYYIISRAKGYGHLFVYNRFNKNLKAVQNTRTAFIRDDQKMALNAVAPNLVIFAVVKENDPEDRHQFYLYHVAKGSLTHFKTCYRVKGKVECENVKL